MEQIKKELITRICKQLTGINAQFHIIVDGEEFGAKPRKPGKRQLRNRGISEYAREHTRTMNPNDVIVVPRGEYVVAELQSAVAGAACADWGPGSYVTHRVQDGVEILRVF
jgi:hypothetical protein